MESLSPPKRATAIAVLSAHCLVDSFLLFGELPWGLVITLRASTTLALVIQIWHLLSTAESMWARICKDSKSLGKAETHLASANDDFKRLMQCMFSKVAVTDRSVASIVHASQEQLDKVLSGDGLPKVDGGFTVGVPLMLYAIVMEDRNRLLNMAREICSQTANVSGGKFIRKILLTIEGKACGVDVTVLCFNGDWLSDSSGDPLLLWGFQEIPDFADSESAKDLASFKESMSSEGSSQSPQGAESSREGSGQISKNMVFTLGCMSRAFFDAIFVINKQCRVLESTAQTDHFFMRSMKGISLLPLTSCLDEAERLRTYVSSITQDGNQDSDTSVPLKISLSFWAGTELLSTELFAMSLQSKDAKDAKTNRESFCVAISGRQEIPPTGASLPRQAGSASGVDVSPSDSVSQTNVNPGPNMRGSAVPGPLQTSGMQHMMPPARNSAIIDKGDKEGSSVSGTQRSVTFSLPAVAEIRERK